MQKLKITSPFNILIIISLIISIIYMVQNINKPPKSNYTNGYYKISGTVIKCQKKVDYYQITIKAKEKILINYYDNYKCNLGQKISVKGTLKKPSKNTVFYQFNYRKYLYSQKIYYQMNADSITILKTKVKWHYKIKNNLKNYIDKYKSKEYLNAFILGDNKEIDKDVISSYQINGISHLLAISGMHITIISSIILFILNGINKHKKTNYFIVILILLFYMFLTGYTPSVIRATFLFICLTIKKVLNLKTETIYFLIFIFSLYLLNNPYIIYNIGFLFSFVITFFLILYSDYLQTKKTYIGKIFLVSLISFIASIPILINNFFEINLLSPFINIIFVPLVSVIMYPLALLSLIIKPLDNILINIINGMEYLSLLISHITVFKLTLKHLTIVSILFYYVLILYTLKGLKNGKNHRLLVFIMVLLIHHNINYFSDNSFVTFIDVGQGDSILLSLGHKGNILIDTGGEVNFNKKTYDIVKNKTIPYLKSEGINKLDYLILTHGDFDHAGLSNSLVKNFKVDKVIFNCGSYNDLEKELMKVLDKKKIKSYSCIKELNIDKNKLYFLQTKEYDNENDNSNVIYTELNGFKFLFMGDASNSTEKEILKKYNLSDIDVLKVGHHGSKTSSSIKFINEINPKYSIISVGKNNRYGHPNKEVLNNLEESKIYRTDQDGSIMFKGKNNKLQVETCSS